MIDLMILNGKGNLSPPSRIKPRNSCADADNQLIPAEANPLRREPPDKDYCQFQEAREFVSDMVAYEYGVFWHRIGWQEFPDKSVSEYGKTLPIVPVLTMTSYSD